MNGDKADCDCFRVNETHIVETTAIQDTAVKRLTQAECTSKHPCDIDQAPVCKAIKYGEYKVNKVKYDWVSTYSYRGWCSLLNLKPKACDQNAIGYTGDLYWAVCDLRYARLVPLLPGRGNPCSMGSPEHRMFVSCLGGYGAYNAATCCWNCSFTFHTVV